MLDVKPLRRIGLFRRYGIIVSLRQIYEFDIIFVPELDSITVTVSLGEERIKYYVKCAYITNNFGRRYYFVCPRTGKNTEKLYLHKGGFLSRSAISVLSVRNGSPSHRNFVRFFGLIARLQGTDGKGPARGQNRLAILDELRGDRLTLIHFPEIAAEVEKMLQSQMKKLLRQKSSIKCGPFSTSAGLEASYEPAFKILAHGIPELEDQPRPVMPDLAADAVWHHPAVDLPTLLAEMDKAGELVRTFHMVWQRGDPACYATIVVDIRYGYRPGLSARIMVGSLQEMRSAHIVRGANGRHRLICPYTRMACDALFIRGGLLGSRQALHLRYPNYTRDERLRHRPPGDEKALQNQLVQMQANHDGIQREDGERFEELDRVRVAMLKRAFAGDGASQRAYLTTFGDWDSATKFARPANVSLTVRRPGSNG